MTLPSKLSIERYVEHSIAAIAGVAKLEVEDRTNSTLCGESGAERTSAVAVRRKEPALKSR